MTKHSDLNSAAIAAHCATGAAHVCIEVVDETGSTNADLLARCATLAGPTLRIAGQQTAGRGRAGRPWVSQADASLMFSLAWHFKGPLHQLVGLPLAVGVALAETMSSLGVPVQLKWPNDLLKDGSKLAGILIETQGAADGGTWTVIGIGLNLLMPDQLEERIGRSVAAAPWLARMDRDALVASLLDALAAAMEQFDAAGFAAFRARWDALHAWHGQPVAIVDNGATLQHGVAAGVDDSGRLLLDTDAGRIAVLAGDVSLRLREN